MELKVYQFTKGDTLISLSARLLDGTRTPIDLSTDTVVFRMVPAIGGTPKIDGATAVIEDAAAGLVRYDWSSADVDTAGQFYGWFIRTRGDLVEHFPIGRLLRIEFAEAD